MKWVLWYGENANMQPCQGVLKVTQTVYLPCQLTHYLAAQGVILKHHYEMPYWQRRARMIDLLATAELFSQWQRLLEADLPLLTCVQLAMPSKPSLALRWQLWLIQDYLQQGFTLSQACTEHGLLPQYQIALIAAGETQAGLGQVLGLLAQQQKQSTQLSKKLKRSLLMPSITLAVGAVVCVLILLFLVPNIASLVQHSQAPIPRATQWLLNASTWLQVYGYKLAVISPSLVLVFAWFGKTPLGLRWKNRLSARLPIWRGIYLLRSQLLVMQLLATSLASGVPLLSALQQCQSACPNDQLAKRLANIRCYLQAGMSLSHAFAKGGYADEQVVMIRLAEQSGDLASVCEQISEQLGQSLADKIESFSLLLEPLITTFLALLVGGLVVAIYLPLMQMGSLL